MMELLVIGSFLACVGVLFYFRYTDARNVTVQTLKDYLKQSEKHIEMMLRKKEKDFNDKMIASEIVIDRMHRLSVVIQEKLELFDSDIIQGEELYNSLKYELSSVQEDLYEYKKIRAEFKDIEDRISSILGMKAQAEEGSAELILLRNKLHSFEEEYTQMSGELKFKTRNDLESFFTQIQNDLADYLVKAKKQLEHKDEEMANQIQELGSASNSMAESIREFKEYAHSSIEQLKKSSADDLEMVKSVTENNITDIYDMWAKVKEETSHETSTIFADMQHQKDFFEVSEENLKKEMQQFQYQLGNLEMEWQSKINSFLQEKVGELESRFMVTQQEIDKKGVEVQDSLEKSLNVHVLSVQEELERLYSAFIEQEQALEDKIKVLGSKISESVGMADSNFKEHILDLTNKVDETKMFADNVLESSHLKIEEKITQIEHEFRSKAQENISNIEDTFRETNQEKITQSISDITKSLELEFKIRFEANVDEVFMKVEELQEVVLNKISYVDELDQRFAQINTEFNSEKEKILLMCSELEKDRENSIEVVLTQVNQYMGELQSELTESAQDFFEEGRVTLVNDQELWKERFGEIVKEGRDEYQKIKHEIDTIHRFISNLEDTSLTNLKREAERVTQETEYKVDDLKKYIGDVLRNGKEDFLMQIDAVKLEVKESKQDLWSLEKDIQQAAQKDLERVSTSVREMDKRFSEFMKKAERLDKVEELLRKIQNQQIEMNDLKQELVQTTINLKDNCKIGDSTINKLTIFKEELEKRAEDLGVRSSEADRIQEFLLSAVQEAKNVSHIFETLGEENAKAKQIEELLMKNIETFNDLQDSLVQLENRKNIVEQLMQQIEDSTSQMAHVENSSEEMKLRVLELDGFSREIQHKLDNLQQEMKSLAGDQTKVKSAISKLNDLDHMVIHIDEEMKRLEKMRDWIAKSMNNVDRMGVQSGIKAYASNEDTLEDANVKHILRLYEKDWSIGDIAKNLKVSPAYVELIIERYRS